MAITLRLSQDNVFIRRGKNPSLSFFLSFPFSNFYFLCLFFFFRDFLLEYNCFKKVC